MKIEHLIESISGKNAIHGKKLQKNFASLSEDENYIKDYDGFISKYREILEKKNLTFDDSINYYLKMIGDFNEEMLDFIRTNKYRNTSFDEVNRAMYNNPDVMVSHMHGLLLSQFLWKHHYAVYQYFKTQIQQYLPVESYLEIGAGHGLYLEAAMEKIGDNCTFEALDISESSLELTKSLIKSEKVVYHLKNVFDYTDEDEKKDFITMGEVLEHVEDPLSLLNKIKSLIKPDGTIFITTPTNAPSIDHIYLFNNIQEIRDLIHEAGLEIVDERYFVSEDIELEKAEKRKVATMYASFLKIKNI
ncbi:class I SAM-dependent methyltransferase [Chryseobacterium shigense]|uniref:2-polyprenyl-3-methyl-5-hydroxy-6-metoxy-1, 4-benzoquinol methylase n=1 Tax=Chryseobacterium shigense TaxID=297244 RepID=A0A841NK64_9FLAO|nr:class I SAM-dependent methyltransferase [Chryseobacterium shigense]MBB6371649.1 2-polyprenyl-3-methyl-5-hydroxy-6-metoxy-1,4-benzoquinol methylase [Chryseobacterium shigense]